MRTKILETLKKMSVNFEIVLHQEHDDPRDHFDNAEFPEDAQNVIDGINSGNPWAWCTIEVKASVTIGGFKYEASDYLGACSYKDEVDFKGDGYYTDMVAQATDALADELAEQVKRGHVLKMELNLKGAV